jgi:hypothetical protein
MKDAIADRIDRRSLKRIEHLRRSIVEKLKMLKKEPPERASPGDGVSRGSEANLHLS